MSELGIEVILAHSPQAKGRVERGFDTHQDRLVKELRLAGISSMEAANPFLRNVYIPKHNRSYAVEPADSVDVHKPLLPSHDLAAILSHQTPRQVQNDFTVRYKNRFFQIGPQQSVRLCPKAEISVQERLDGSIHLVFKGRQLKFHEIPGRPLRPAPVRPSQHTQATAPLKPPRRRVNPFYAGFSLASSKAPWNPPASALLQA